MDASTFKTFRKCVIGLNIAAILAIAFFILMYLCRFSGGFSKSSQDWTNFGGYFAGTVGVILVAMNFLDIYYIYVKLGRATHQQYLTNLRAPAYKIIIDELYRVREDSYNIGVVIQNLKTWLENTDFNSLLFLRDDQVPLFEELKGKLLDNLGPLLTVPDGDESRPGHFLIFKDAKTKMIKQLMYLMRETNN